MLINRPIYLKQLIARQHNCMVKFITGLRLCGLSKGSYSGRYATDLS